MAMESNESLTSYLKSMFVQFHGEEQLPAAPSPAPAAVIISSESRRSSESASIKSMTVEEDSSSSEVLENITSLKLSKTSASPPTSTSDETDINNNDKESALKDSTSPQLMTNGSSTIEVNVDVHHSANHNDSIDAIKSTVEEEEDDQSLQKTVSHNKIALTFLDELKENLQVKDDGKAGEEQSVMEKEAGDTTAEKTKDSWEGGVRQEEATSPPPEVQSGGSSLRDDEASTAESGIGQEDLEEQWSGQTSSGSSSSPTIESNFSNTAPSSSNRLVRSASSTLFSSSNGGKRVVLRSISQDVRFKLESIKEEKKVTKSHVSELANFWKGKMISPKDNS